MKIRSQCVICFMKQAQEMISKFESDRKIQIELLKETVKKAEFFTEDMIPLELSPFVYGFLSERLGVEDLYLEEKNQTNQKALELEPYAAKLIKESKNPLKTAARLSIIGNIIDYGVQNVNDLDLKAFLKENLLKEFESDESDLFFEELKKSDNLLYLTDNSGEIIFDRLFLKEIKMQFPALNIKVAAKEKPILNDITYDELFELGFSDFAKLYSTGSTVPGTMPKFFSAEFQKIWNESQVVLAKGQGNFEGLWENEKSIYFAFMAKCPVLADYLEKPLRSLIFAKNHV